MIYLSSGVALQHRKEHNILIALLPYGFSKLRYYKHKISDVLVLEIISFPYKQKKNKKFNKFRSHVELGWVNRILHKL